MGNKMMLKYNFIFKWTTTNITRPFSFIRMNVFDIILLELQNILPHISHDTGSLWTNFICDDKDSTFNPQISQTNSRELSEWTALEWTEYDNWCFNILLHSSHFIGSVSFEWTLNLWVFKIA